MNSTLLYVIAGIVIVFMFGVMIFYHPESKANN